MPWIMQDALLGSVDLTLIDTVSPGPYALAGANAGKSGRYSLPSQFVDATDPVLGGAIFAFAQVAAIAPQTISSIALAGTTATLTTAVAHGLAVGGTVTISGAAPLGYNNQFVIATVPSATTLTFDVRSIVNQSTQQLGANPNQPAGPATTVGSYVGGLGAGQIVQFTHVLDAATGNLVLQSQVWAGTANSGLSLGASVNYPAAGQWAWFQIGGAMVVNTNGAPAVGNQTYWDSAGTVKPTAVASKQMQGVQYATAAGATLGAGSSARTLAANQAVVWGTFPLAQGAIT
jgi:hypothetical protein